ncbi:type II toxin-antitoxin system YhaV family toxin [Nitrosomonas supralitoralis]|uniref:Toxin YhaV n=1 Tax=Nitrosomonas supralitoralis TaxID=2116706 RepID=A0A2P7NUM8_9PROT|nr:type II toxin-antitoxin system YhaV family toxin [Nitrosomonas supralitoralis]PSJ17138.1 toxin YhaV [Nitrosomonas supralitoralis]
MPGQWSLLFHHCLLEQLERLKRASDKALAASPDKARENANVKLYAALAKLMLEIIPSDPGRDEYRQGNTMGPDFRHWRRAKIGRRFRLFFRYDSSTKVIVYAWVNDANTLRAKGSKHDPYAVFQKMLDRGNPPDDWDSLLRESSEQAIKQPAKPR